MSFIELVKRPRNNETLFRVKKSSSRTPYVTVVTIVKTPASEPNNLCRENNGGCGENVCVEVQSDVFDFQVKCNSPDKEIFNVPEVYVKPKNDWIYKGCFNKVQSSKELRIDSVKSCFEYCKETSFYAMKDGRLCTCANSVENEAGADKCDKKCSDGLSCGGSSFHSVYASNSETCQCGRKIEFKDQLSKEQCKEPSVFALLSDVSPDLDVQGKPTKYNYCMNDKIEIKKAYCKTGHCKFGWNGALCDKRDCDNNSGDCPKAMMCVQEIINNVLFEKCLCGEGLLTTSESECKKSDLAL
ncbi:hypothetical protein HELRODRAFT_177738 [Helobdella robusta]|uniref:WSC domain-containing protein n=1 Tax=Helobdella robusta TaxID=6412 RepID=T1FC60_HELRO|nr:hypothetical protein HELRODRAFT_177738 [Helobdella robusta]ESN97683.1 hypothetical protein HELRODRAFT_177738 [Helobdella robusta]